MGWTVLGFCIMFTLLYLLDHKANLIGGRG